MGYTMTYAFARQSAMRVRADRSETADKQKLPDALIALVLEPDISKLSCGMRASSRTSQREMAVVFCDFVIT